MNTKNQLLEKIKNNSITIGVIGLGYVGLPLAVEFGKQYKTIGFDINKKRIEELKNGHDRTLEVSSEELKEAEKLEYTFELEGLKQVDVYIVTVPTPIDEYKRPDLTPLIKASETVGKVLQKGNVVVYESTVYPGCTEEDCVPVLEKVSGLKFEQDFYCGYSPERINPGDKEHRVSTIKKIVSGSNPEIADGLNQLYQSIITAGTHESLLEASSFIETIERRQGLKVACLEEIAYYKKFINKEQLTKLANEYKNNYKDYLLKLVR